MVSLKLPRPVVFSAVIVLLIVGAHAPWALGEPGRARAPAELDVAEILEQVTRATELPPGIGFRQEIVLRAFFSTWRFEAEVRLEPDGRVSSKTKGAPSFLPDSFAVELVELGRSPYLFDLRLIEVQDDGLYVLQGPRRGPRERGSGGYFLDRPPAVGDRKSRGGLPLGSFMSAKSTHAIWDTNFWQGRKPGNTFGFTLDIIYRDYQIP